MKFFEKTMIEEYLEEYKSGDKVKITNKNDDFYGMKGTVHKVGKRKQKGYQTVKLSNGQVVSYEDSELMLNEAPLASKGWTDKSISKFGKTIGKDPKDKGFFAACVKRMQGKEGFDAEKARGFCAAVKDKSFGSPNWRGSGKTKKEVTADTKKDKFKK